MSRTFLVATMLFLTLVLLRKPPVKRRPAGRSAPYSLQRDFWPCSEA